VQLVSAAPVVRVHQANWLESDFKNRRYWQIRDLYCWAGGQKWYFSQLLAADRGDCSAESKRLEQEFGKHWQNSKSYYSAGRDEDRCVWNRLDVGEKLFKLQPYGKAGLKALEELDFNRLSCYTKQCSKYIGALRAGAPQVRKGWGTKLEEAFAEEVDGWIMIIDALECARKELKKRLTQPQASRTPLTLSTAEERLASAADLLESEQLCPRDLSTVSARYGRQQMAAAAKGAAKALRRWRNASRTRKCMANTLCELALEHPEACRHLKQGARNGGDA